MSDQFYLSCCYAQSPPYSDVWGRKTELLHVKFIDKFHHFSWAEACSSKNNNNLHSQLTIQEKEGDHINLAMIQILSFNPCLESCPTLKGISDFKNVHQRHRVTSQSFVYRLNLWYELLWYLSWKHWTTTVIYISTRLSGESKKT